MTIQDCITELDALKPNVVSPAQKVQWLSRLEGNIYEEIIKHREGASDISFDGYNATDDMNTVLIVPDMYAELYIAYLVAEIDFYNNEFNHYNTTSVAFNSRYKAFSDYWLREHRSTRTSERKNLF